MILIGSISAVQFADIYGKSLTAAPSVDAILLPNLVFTLAVLLYMVLNYKTKDDAVR